jgi:hypothetical protein
MNKYYAAALSVMLGVSLPAAAEVLEMPGDSSQMAEPAVAAMPVRGMHKDQVRARFGEPREVKAPVGDPPITRWIYDGYTVYFEYSYVIQSVANR